MNLFGFRKLSDNPPMTPSDDRAKAAVNVRKPAEILPITYTEAVFPMTSDNPPITYRRPSDNHPSPYRGRSLGSLPHGGDETGSTGKVWFVLSGSRMTIIRNKVGTI